MSAAPAAAPTFPPLLTDSSGYQIKSARAWQREASRLKAQWLAFLGSLPEKRSRITPVVLHTEFLAGYNRSHISYEVEPGVQTDGYLLEPSGPPPAKGKRPAVVVFHPTTPLQAKSVAGVALEYPAEKQQGVQLVKLGFVVWCPRNFINTDDRNYLTNTLDVLSKHTNWTGMARMLLDAMRAADFLEKWPGVDRERIGCLGHSLGAKQVLYAMAFDARYKAGVFSEGGIGISFSNWDAPWYLGPGIHKRSDSFEHHQLIALIAPRAFLLVAGDSADNDHSREFVGRAQPVFSLLRAPKNLQFYNHHEGHAYPANARASAEAFLITHLAGKQR